MSEAALNGLRVIDFSSTRAGTQASQTLADFGADVIIVEPVGGAPVRAEAAWEMWGRGKRAIQLDLKSEAGKAVAHTLSAGADVVIETWRPGVAERLGLGYEALSTVNPALIYGSVTGFGRIGPLASLQGYEGIVAARMGVNWSLEGMAGRPGPAFCTAAYATYPASQLLVQGILAGLHARARNGLGQRVDTSLVEGLTVHDTFQWFARVVAQRYDGFTQAARVVDGVPAGGLSFRLLIALTKDGHWLQFSQTVDRLFKAMMRMFGLSWMFSDPRWESAPNFDRIEDRREFWEILLGVVRTRTAAEWAALFDQDTNVWGELFRNDAEALEHPQMVWNRMAAAANHPGIGDLTMPGPITRMDATPADVSRPAPGLGEYDAAIAAEAAQPRTRRPLATSLGEVDPTAPPLAGVTIVELGSYYAAPYGATLLAELGARVIKLEPLDGDPQRNMLPFPELAGMKCLQGKESVAVDLVTPAGLALAHRIIASSDIVLQSFRAGVAKRLKLDSETLLALNPGLVYLAAPGYGEDGPCGHRPAFAPTIGAAAGLAWRNVGAQVLSGPDLTLAEVKTSAMQLASAVMGVGNADGISAVTAGTAMMLGLAARDRAAVDGGAGGQKLFTSMLSSVAHAISEACVEYPGRPTPPTADRDLYGLGALYRLYVCADGEWIFLAAPHESEWTRLTAALPGGTALATDCRFESSAARADHDADLAAALAAIFAKRPGAEWETLVRAADVACVVAARAPVEARYLDPGEAGEQCGLITHARHPVLDDIPRLKPLWRFSRAGTVAGDSGLVGQQTTKVLADYGFTDDEVAALAAEKVIAFG
jgi:crotonobetainyl-CoA:carnitine CoA-transferase CaiB-like acyl-CoA transferase